MGARVEEGDFEPALDDRPVLADQLIELRRRRSASCSSGTSIASGQTCVPGLPWWSAVAPMFS
jgi:hypothetical protein